VPTVDLSVSEFHDRTYRFFSGVLRDLSVRKGLECEVLEVASQVQLRIGQELHDGAGQELTVLGQLTATLVEALQKTYPAEAVLASKITKGLKRVLGQVRALSRGLVPEFASPGGKFRQGCHAHLAEVRSADRLAALPAAERAGWEKLWADLVAIVAKARQMK
jgi:signal transduction histidine kinase